MQENDCLPLGIRVSSQGFKQIPEKLLEEARSNAYSLERRENFQEMELEVIPVNKVNGIKDGLIMTENFQEGKKVSPTLYINDMYEAYSKTGDFEKVMLTAAENMVNSFDHIPKAMEVDFENVQDNIVFQVVNTA